MNIKKDNTRNLPDAELDIMKAIWHADYTLTSNEIIERLENKRSWKRATLHVLITRLCEKNFLDIDKSGRGFRYVPLISEDEYRQSESKSLLQRIYDGSAKSMVASLIDTGELNGDDIAELAELLNGKRDNNE